MVKDTLARSTLKALSWRITATTTTMVIVFAAYGELMMAAAIGGIEAFAKMALYFFHERAWERVGLGRRFQDPFVIWLTGLPASGKTTLAVQLEKNLKGRGLRVEVLDSSRVRSLFPQTGYSAEERDRHIRRIGHLASLLEKNGVIVISAFISPYRESRDFARKLCNNFIEVHVSTPLEVCESRDPKGLYARARRGELANVTGIDDDYEAPERAELTVDTSTRDLSDCVQAIEKHIARHLI